MMPRWLTISVTFLLLLMAAALGLEQRVGLNHAFAMTGKWLAPATASAQTLPDPPPTTHAIFSSMLQKAGISNEITSQDVFGEQPKNLYTYIYQQIFDRPEQEALMELASAYGLTPTDAQIVLQGGVTPLMRGRQNYTQDAAVRDLKKVMDSYTEILKKHRMKYELSAMITPTEIFTNGDLSDSGFDLIHDLDLIEEILFIDKTKVYLNQKPFNTNVISLTGGSSADGGGASANTPGVFSLGNTGSITTGNGGDSISHSASPSVQTFTLDDLIKGQQTGSGSTLNQCAASSTLQKALTVYDSGGGSGGASQGSNTRAGAGAKNSPAGELPPSVNQQAISDIAPPEYHITPVQPSNAFNAPSASFCNDLGGTTIYTYRTKLGTQEREIFCLNIDKHVRTYTSFSPDRSCIQCMIAGMNESMKSLLSKNITPNKLTGSTYESTKCKSAIQLSSMLDININFVPTPVITPQKYGPFVANDIGKMWNNVAKNDILLPSAANNNADTIQNEALQNLGGGNLGSDGKPANPPSQTDVLGEIQKAYGQHIGEIEARNANLLTVNATSFKDSAYQQIIVEMRQMSNYFAMFKDIFAHFSGQSCPAVLDKPAVDQK